MTISAHGVIKGRQIKLDRKTGLPPGSRVQVRIKANSRTLEERRRLAARLFGSCADDPTFAAQVLELERQRHMSLPRQVRFDVAP